MEENNKSNFDWDGFITEGAETEGDRVPLSVPQKIPWFNKSVFQRGRSVFLDNIIICGTYSTIGSMLNFLMKPFALTHFRNYNLYPDNHFFDIGVSSIKAVKIWIESDVMDEDGPGFKGIKRIRNLHAGMFRQNRQHHLLPLQDVPEKYHGFAETMRTAFADYPTPESSKVSHLQTWNSKVPFSQLQVALLQFFLFYPMWMFPMDPYDLHCLTYWWAVVGRMLGLEDRYNLALHQDKRLYEKVLRAFIIPSAKDCDLTTAMILQTGVDSIPILGNLFQASVYLAADELGCNGKVVWKNMSFREKIGVYFLKVVTFLNFYAPLGRTVLNYFGLLILRVVVYLRAGIDWKKDNRKSEYFQGL